MRYGLKILFLLFLIHLFLWPVRSFAQINTYKFGQLDSLQQTEIKKTVIFVHTDWCRYCGIMRNTTFKNDRIVTILNKYYYFVDFNAEERDNITFNKHTFSYRPTGTATGLHELAEQLALADGKIAFPAICILNNRYEIVFQYNQFISYKDLETILMQLK